MGGLSLFVTTSYWNHKTSSSIRSKKIKKNGQLFASVADIGRFCRSQPWDFCQHSAAGSAMVAELWKPWLIDLDDLILRRHVKLPKGVCVYIWYDMIWYDMIWYDMIIWYVSRICHMFIYPVRTTHPSPYYALHPPSNTMVDVGSPCCPYSPTGCRLLKIEDVCILGVSRCQIVVFPGDMCILKVYCKYNNYNNSGILIWYNYCPIIIIIIIIQMSNFCPWLNRFFSRIDDHPRPIGRWSSS